MPTGSQAKTYTPVTHHGDCHSTQHILLFHTHQFLPANTMKHSSLQEHDGSILTFLFSKRGFH